MGRSGGRRRGRGGRRRGGPPRDERVDLERYRDFIPDWADFVEAASRPEPTVLRVRSGRIAPAELRARLSARGLRLRAVEGLPDFYRVDDGPLPASLTLEHWLGLFYLQQASTGVAAPALAPEPEERVLDLCAAPGGKTTHICELMGDRGCVVASEISESRIRGLLGNVYRLGHTNVLAVAGDGRDFPEGPLFDRVLVDAPCSGEGTLRRRAGTPPNQSRSFLDFVTGAQRGLLAKAVRLTRPGGVVLYVTCTFAPEENEAVVTDALERLPVELVPLDLAVPHAPGLTAFDGRRFDARLEGAARIYPHHLDSGGLFLAKLRKLGGDVGGAPPGAGTTPGWSPVPALFPDGDAPSSDDAALAIEGMRRAVEEVAARFGVHDRLGEVGWISRGARAWLHTAGTWPLGGWPDGGWRAISLGLRAVEIDGRGRARPTNDLLRWVGAGRGVVDPGEPGLRALLAGEAIAADAERPGPVALGLGGDVLGRGAVGRAGLTSEIPKARARDLLRCLDAG